MPSYLSLMPSLLMYSFNVLGDYTGIGQAPFPRPSY
jgi:hypothetical protein